MVRIRRTDYKQSSVPFNKYRKSFLYNVILEKMEEHLISIDVVFKENPNATYTLKGNKLREFIWCIRSKEAEGNIDVWASLANREIAEEIEKLKSEEGE